MASAAVDDCRAAADLHMESLPLLDIRLLSRQELLALSCCSASNPPISALDTDLLTPKIDRSVFNESAGSRKQTFSRLRLAPPRSNFHFSSPPKPFSASSSLVREAVGEENAEIVRSLKALFDVSSVSSSTTDLDSGNLVSVRVESEDNVSSPRRTGWHTVDVDVVDYSERKSKRGRPPKNTGEDWAPPKDIVLYENSDDMSLANAKSCDLNNSSGVKRKRGRPRKNNGENLAIQKDIVLYENPDGMSLTSEKSSELTNNTSVKRKRGRPRKNESRNIVAITDDSRIKSDRNCNMTFCDNIGGVVAVNGKFGMVELDGIESWVMQSKASVSQRNPDGKFGAVSTNSEIKGKCDNVEEVVVAVNGTCRMVDSIALEKDGIRSWVTQTEAIDTQRNLDGMLHENEKSGDLCTTSEAKRKRGRSRKSATENIVVKKQKVTECKADSENNVLCDNVNAEVVVVSDKGELVDLVALGKIEDPFGEELRRRTESMKTEGEFLDFMKSLEGYWVSQRKKRRIVDADNFGHILPKGWKLMLFVKKNAGRKWLACRRYIRFSYHVYASLTQLLLVLIEC